MLKVEQSGPITEPLWNGAGQQESETFEFGAVTRYTVMEPCQPSRKVRLVDCIYITLTIA